MYQIEIVVSFQLLICSGRIDVTATGFTFSLNYEFESSIKTLRG